MITKDKLMEAVSLHGKMYQTASELVKGGGIKNLGIISMLSQILGSCELAYRETAYKNHAMKYARALSRDRIVNIVKDIYKSVNINNVDVTFTQSPALDGLEMAVSHVSGCIPNVLIPFHILMKREVDVINLMIGIRHEAQHSKQFLGGMKVPDIHETGVSTNAYWFHPLEVDARNASYSEGAIKLYHILFNNM